MKKRIIALLLVLVLLVPTAMASAAKYYRLKTKARLWQLPDYKSVVIDTYRQDWALTVDKSIDKTWSSITFTNGVFGYMEKNHYSYSSSYTAYVTRDNSNVKRGPDYSFETLETVMKGAKVTVYTTGSLYNYVKTASGTYGYLPRSILSKKKVAPTPAPKPADPYTAYVVSKGGTVGLRTSPSGANSAVYANIPYGTKITVLIYDPAFCYVDVNGSEGYMRTKYTSKYEPAPLPEGGGGSTPFSPYYTTAKKDSKGNSPRLYQGVGLGWSSVKVGVGDTIYVESKTKTDIYWFKVQVNGQTGYMPNKFFN